MTAAAATAEAASAVAGLVVEDRFAIVPEWLLDADVSDTAIRLYAVLLRYGQTSGSRMPGRATLARRLRKKSTDTVDRAMRELEQIGAVQVEHRYAGGQRLTNLYHLKATRGPVVETGGSRNNAATPDGLEAQTRVMPGGGGRTDTATGSRSRAAGVAADLRPNPEHLTQTSTPSPTRDRAQRAEGAHRWREEEDRFLRELGIHDMDRYVTEVQALRADAGAPTGRWSRPPLVAALQAAVRARGWPAATAAAALKAVAVDPGTRSPMRVAEGGPWWDLTAAPNAVGQSAAYDVVSDGDDPAPFAIAEAELAEADGLRVLLQRTAREQLAAEGTPVTRVTVLRRAHQLLLQTRDRQGVPA